MCGIVGFNKRLSGENVDIDLCVCFEDVVKKLTHRGPDDWGVYASIENGVCVGHTRLSIQDVTSMGHQPMIDKDEDVIIVFNGEIYNFMGLRSELESAGYVFKGGSDTEVLLNMYIECQRNRNPLENMLRRLNGIFAFAIWDKKKETLILVRDSFGVKPLYYYQSDGYFAFSSEIKALMYLVADNGGLDYLAIHQYMSFLWSPGERTPLKNIKKLGPGELLYIKNGVIERHYAWYKLPIYMPNNILRNIYCAIGDTEKYIRQAVYRQMTSDVPLGAFLSGGLDSSSIVAFAKEYDPKIQCFTIETKVCEGNDRENDLPYAKSVAKYLGLKLEVVRVDASKMANDLEGMVTQLDEPLADPAPLNVLYISRLAREQGIKVLLSGAGGDDLFTGYRRHQAILIDKYWDYVPSIIKSRIEHASYSIDKRKVFGRRMAKLFNGATLNGDSRLVNYFLWNKRQDLIELYAKEFRAYIGYAEAAEPMYEFLKSLPEDTPPLNRMLALEQKFFLTDHNLNYTDKMSMAVGVEVRVPFLDLDLVEFANKIPLQWKQHGREGKWILKKTMESFLPKEVIYRQKNGFGAPLRHWMRYELREILGDILSTDSLKRRGLFDPIAVHKLIKDNDSGRIDASYTLLSLLSIELWCRRFIDQNNTVVAA